MRSPNVKPSWSAFVARAGLQEGLVRGADLAALGYHPRHVRRLVLGRRLHEVHRGVYALSPVLTRRAVLLAAVFWAGDGAALSHESAAAFYGWVADDLAVVHVSVPSVGFGVRSAGGVIVHRTRHLEHRDVVTYGLLRVTDRVRTIVDLADHLTYEELRAVADELPSLPTRRLLATAARLPGRAGAGRTHRLIHSEDAHTRSEMERRYVQYCTVHDVPHPDARNVRVHGVLVDCWYAGARLVVELDSRAHHTRRKEFEADRRRDRALKRHGIDTMRLTWHDLDAGDALAASDLLRQLAGG